MRSPNTTVVLIDDDACIRHFVRASLTDEGMAVFEAATGMQGLSEAATRWPDLLIVDVHLPDIDGIELIREFRRWSTSPLIVLSSMDREADKVAALNAGADDYLTKPFGLPELKARIHAHLRRQACEGATGATTICFGSIVVHLGERRVTREGRPVHLSRIEYRLLAELVRHANQLMTHDELLRAVWGPAHAKDHHYLRVYVGHLRQRLERDPTHPEHIITEAGTGYRLVGTR
ncbi:two-component system response regulator [Burkholderia territorii]|uniref:response regulator n=1 Tax=Burkholderia territorii TaxID=1503055 RepID=UPI000751B2D9|nr:response regulator [Burkholderia territorii]KWA48264.1 two-component system response regulator [Burkholderia territorii]